MKYLNATAIGTILMTSITISAQDYNPFTGESFELIGNWSSKLTYNNTLVINTDGIKNNTTSNKNIDIDFFLVPHQEKYTSLQLSNAVPVTLKIGNISGDSTFNQKTKIDVDLNNIKNLAPNNYQLVAVFRDRSTSQIIHNQIFNEVLNYNTVLDNTITTSDNIAQQSTKPRHTTSIRKRNRDRIEFSNIVDQMSMNGEWQLDIDFETMEVNINGNGNDIINKRNEPTNNLKLLVYFVENTHDGTNKIIEGYEVLEADLNPIKERGEFKNLKLKANITKYIPSGEYYPILLVSELESDGIYKVKTFIQFENKYVL